MTHTWRSAFFAAAATILSTGCSTSPPGAGLTNGEPLGGGGTERAAERTDLPTPSVTSGDASLAAPAADSQVTAPPAPEAPGKPAASGAAATRTPTPATPGGPGAETNPK